jgi:hypothetical protein
LEVFIISKVNHILMQLNSLKLSPLFRDLCISIRFDGIKNLHLINFRLMELIFLMAIDLIRLISIFQELNYLLSYLFHQLYLHFYLNFKERL